MPRQQVLDEIELIEIVDPAAFDGTWDSAYAVPRSASTHVPDRRATWGLVGVGLAIALVWAAVAWFDRPPPPPLPAEGRYVAVDPGLRNYSTDLATPFDDAGAFRVWAVGGPEEPHATIEVDARAREPFVMFDGSTRTVHGLRFVDTLGRPDSVTVVRDLGAGARLVVRATGMSDADVAATVNGTNVVLRRGRVQRVVMPASVQRSLGLQEVVTSRWADEALYGDVQSTMRYLDASSNVVTLRVAKGSLPERVTALDYLGNRPSTVRGDRHVGQLATTGDAVVLWEQDGYVLSLTWPGDPQRYVAISQGVRRATATEWDTQLIFLRPDFRVGDFAVLGRGDGWRAGVQRAERGGATKLLWWFTVPSEPGTSTSVPMRFEPTVAPFADRLVVDGVTYVLVSAPATTGVTGASVYFGHGEVQRLTLTQPFADVPVVMAAFRVDTAGPVRVMSPG